MPKRILIIGAGSEQRYGYELAHRLGHSVVGTDQDPKAPAFGCADDRLIASTRDPRGSWACVKKFIINKKIDGVMTLANDVPLTVAMVAKKLKVPGLSPGTAKLAADKLAMKKKFSRDGVSIPGFCEVRGVADIRRRIREWGYPLIIKPVDNRGARGVLRISKGVDLPWAYREALRYSFRKKVILEKFIEGPQISTEGFVLNGECHTVALSDRNYEYLDKFSPYIIENGGTMPSKLPDHVLNGIKELMQKAVRSLGIKNGPVKGDIVVDAEGNPYIIELAARLSGGYFCTHQIPLSTGVDLVKATMRYALGEQVTKKDLAPRSNAHVAIRYWFPISGRLKAVPAIHKIRKEKNVHWAEIHKKIGDRFGVVKKHPDRLGFVIVWGNSYEEAAEAADRIIKKYQNDFLFQP